MKVRALYEQVIFREAENPFIKRKTESGLFLPQGMAFTQETGDMEKLDKIIGFGIVVEVGKQAEYVKPGDGIFYDRRSIRAIPVGEVMWQMSEKGLVGYIDGNDEEFQEKLKHAGEEEAAIMRDLKEKVKQEEEAKVEKFKAVDNAQFKSSPLIKIN